MKPLNKNTLDNKKIYKVNYIVNGSIESIYVFHGKGKQITNEEEFYDEIFTPEENERRKRENINVKFSDQEIHFDDNIGTIKIKILNELAKHKKIVSLDEIYLYCQKVERLNSVSVYQSLTQNKKIQLTKIRLDQFMSNIVSEENGSEIKMPETKEVYTFDDILNLKLDDKKFVMNKVLGQKFFIVENEYPFVCDPFNAKDYDTFFEKSARKSLSTLNSHILLNTGKIIVNNIYLCLAEDVLKYAESKDISQQTTLKIYYPFLYNKNVNNIDDLDEVREKLIESNKKIITPRITESFKTIDMFYDIYKMRNSELNYDKKGIKYIRALLKPEFDVKIPLEIIFKIVHATENSPLIKFNSSTRQENIYRLYTDATATDGRKIPYLKKASIFKLIKTIGKTKSVSVYIESNKDENIICEFDENGYITISSEFKVAMNEIEVDTLFRDYVNPIIEEVKNFLEQSGYKLGKFNSLKDENVEIKQLTYETKIQISKPLKLDSFKGCISAVFTNETNVFKSDGKQYLRFKRVSNFSKVTSQEAFILEKSTQGYKGYEIIELLLENFPEDLDRANAEDLVRKVANEIQVERGVRKSEIKIKENPGFKTIIVLEKETGVITITVENINDIYYLDTIPIYLDSMVRLTQDKNSTSYPTNEINKLCSTGEKEDIIIPDIISASEESAESYEIPSIEEEEDGVEYNKYKEVTFGVEKPKGAFSLFFDEDEDEENEYEAEGGVNNSDSGSSISSEGNNYIVKEIASPIVLSPVEKSPSEKDLSSIKIDEITSPEEDQGVKELSSIKIDEIASPEEDQELTHIQMNVEEKSIAPQEIKKPFRIDSDSESEKEKKAPTKAKPFKIDSDTESEKEKKVAIKKRPFKIDSDTDSEDDVENIRNIDGMKLNKPYYFQKMIEKKDPILILKEDTKEFNSYSRTCSSDTRRQPVILTDTQLENIKKEHPSFLKEEDVIKYGSDSNNKFNYICPRYWCLKNNTIIDPEDLKEVKGQNGKIELEHPTCGKVLSRKDKKVKPGYYIYEFYGDNEKKRYPGFQIDKHPDGYCLPCCFDKYNTQGRIRAKDYCYNEDKNKQLEKANKKEDIDEYIKGPDKFPLDPGRWGYLPMEIQLMLREVNADCQISKTNTNIKEDHPCLLRHGIEVNQKQSFVACMSDAIFFAKTVVDEKNKTKKIPAKILSIKEMRQRIIQSINIDTFVKYQNGNLVTNFHDNSMNIDINKHKNSKLYSKLNLSLEPDRIYFNKVISAFDNFVRFLSDDDAIIDHTYLWDIFCMPNKNLFPNGVNLVIFQIPNDDITNNVQLLCPTNHYSNEFFEPRKPTLILIKEDKYYEPIYSYLNSNNKISVTKDFKENKLSPTMESIFKDIIRPFFNKICRPIPNSYKAKRPLMLYDLVQKLDKYEYTILKLVVNFNNKVIGVVAKEPDISNKFGFIPCYPSALNEDLKKDIDFVFMTDLSIWNTHNDTINFLTKLYNLTKRGKYGLIPCKPEFYIVEYEHVVGILTETDQFVQFSKPVRKLDIDGSEDLSFLSNTSYLIKNSEGNNIIGDNIITTSDEVDAERVDYIRRIKLETNFYNVFRNTIRILINDYENVKMREKIEKEMNKQYIIYSEKLQNINRLLRELVKDKIQFIGDENYYKLIKEISTCIVKDREKCEAAPNFCAVTENGVCNLILPEKNLITGKINETIYYGKMSDELIRYNRIKSFILQPQTFLSFGNVGYNLRENEIILLQSLLTQEYFETLVPMIENKYVKYNSYDNVEPINTQVYENNVSLLEEDGKTKKQFCKKINNGKITSSMWDKCFPDDYVEIEFERSSYCTLNFIIDLIERKTGDKLELNKVKSILLNEYNKLLGEYKDKIVDILIMEGKKTYGEQVNANTLRFEGFVGADNYFLTTLDLWILIEKYKIPTIFLSEKVILETNDKNYEFVGFGDYDDKFIFVILPSFSAERIPDFKYIQNDEGDVFISLDKLNEDCVDKIRNAISRKMTVVDFLKSFIKPTQKRKDTKKQELIEQEKTILHEKEKVNIKTKNAKEKNILKENIVPEYKDKISGQMCETTKSPIGNIWRNCFPKNYFEIEYNKFKPTALVNDETVMCNFSFATYLIENKTGVKLDMKQIKSVLLEEYEKYLPAYKNQILDNLILECKVNGKKVKNGPLTFKEFIDSDNYYLTTFDIWLLVQKYKIPTIFIRNKNDTYILQTGNKKNILVGYGELDDSFVFINIPGYYVNNIPNFKYIESDQGEIFISLDKLNTNDKDCFDKIKYEIMNKVSIDEYLKNFTVPSGKKVGGFMDENKPIKKGTLIIEENIIVENIPNKNKTKKNLIKHNSSKKHNKIKN